jgi:hypothetical protein
MIWNNMSNYWNKICIIGTEANYGTKPPFWERVRERGLNKLSTCFESA